MVIDASILAKPFIAEEGGEEVLGTVEGLELWAPALIYFEVGNAICRRARETGTQAAQLAQNLQGMRIRVPAIGEWLNRAAEISVRDRLSYYDAAYVSIAEELKIALWTADEKMARVAEAMGLPLFRIAP